MRLDAHPLERAGEAGDPAAAQHLLRSVQHEDDAQEETQHQDGQPLQPLEPLWHGCPRFPSGRFGPELWVRALLDDAPDGPEDACVGALAATVIWAIIAP